MTQRIEIRCPQCGSNQIAISPGEGSEAGLQCSSCKHTFAQSEALLTTITEDKTDLQISDVSSHDKDILAICQTKGLLAGIKFHKDATGKSLLAAKQHVDSLVDRQGIKPRRGASSGSCYIATTCYGSYDAIEVLVLREFRDQYLATYWPGRLLIRCYYISSPVIKPIVEKSPAFQNFLLKYFLNPVVKALL